MKIISLTMAILLVGTFAKAQYPLAKLTRKLSVACGNTQVNLEGVYYKNSDGQWDTVGRNGVSSDAELVTTADYGGSDQTAQPRYLGARLEDYLFDVIKDGQVVKTSGQTYSGLKLWDIEVTLYPNECKSPYGYKTSFPAQCKGFIIVGDQKISLDTDKKDGIGATNWEYSVNDGKVEVKRGAGTGRTLKDVLAKTKNLADFTHLAADSCESEEN